MEFFDFIPIREIVFSEFVFLVEISFIFAKIKLNPLKGIIILSLTMFFLTYDISL
jgi:hypothetical protein